MYKYLLLAMQRHHFYVFFLLLLMSISSKAEIAYVDSIFTIINTTKNPIEKAELYSRLSFYYLFRNTDSAILCSNKSIQIAKSKNNDTVLARAYIVKSFVLENIGESEECMNYVLEGIRLAELNNKPQMLYSAYNQIASLKKNNSEYAKALTYYYKALEIAEQLKDDEKISRSYNNLGIFYVNQNEFNLAEEFHQKALQKRIKIGDKEIISQSYENLGIVFREKKDYKKAVTYYKKALEINLELHDSSGVAYSFNDIGASLSKDKQLNEAEKYLLESIAIRERINEKEELAYTYNYLGENYERKGQISLAEYNIRKALQTSREINNKKQEIEALQSFADFFHRNQKFDSAFLYTRLYQTYSDSLRKQDNNQLIAKLTMKYENAKKESTIKQQQFELTQKNYYLAGLGLLLLLVSLSSWSFYSQYRSKQEKKLHNLFIEQQDKATKAVLEAEENERQRIAADLHDGIGQLLTAARLNLEGLKSRLNLQSEEEKSIYEKALVMVEDSCKEVRNVSHNIMPNALIKSGLGNAIKDFIEKINYKSLTINLNTLGMNEMLDQNVELVIYRIIQECVNNVIKHSKANQLDISVIRDEEGLQLSIEDNGIGFNKSILQNNGGIGMKNIFARVAFLKGTIDIDSRPGKGTLVAIFIPL